MTFEPIFVPDDLSDAVSDDAWLAALLAAERALAHAEAAAGVIPAAAADAIAAACRPERFDAGAIARAGRAPGNPVEPLVRALTDAVGGEAGGYVHWGATSQDVMDTAAMLVARDALELVLVRLDAAADACAALAERHRDTPMAARTLLQQAVPTTFGLKAAGWLAGLLDARRRLVDLLAGGLAAQLGGAGGTLAALGDDGPEVLRRYAGELGLAEPELPWHTQRDRIAALGAALAVCAGTLAKIGLDIALLAQTEVGEVAEDGGGRSSTMPQKANPARSTVAIACARRVHGHAGVLLAAMAQEHERAAGGWHAEWDALSQALALAGGAAAAVAEALAGLRVDPERMRRNLEASGGLVAAEHVSFVLAGDVGRAAAHERVGAAARRAAAGGRPFRDELAADDAVELDPAALDAALDPAAYLGSAGLFVDRALARHRREREGRR